MTPSRNTKGAAPTLTGGATPSQLNRPVPPPSDLAANPTLTDTDTTLTAQRHDGGPALEAFA
jgi:hypothetical protein